MSSLGSPLFGPDHGTRGMNGLFSSMSISRTVPSTRTARLNSGPVVPRQRILYDRPSPPQYRERRPRPPLATIAPPPAENITDTDDIADAAPTTPRVPLPAVSLPALPAWASQAQALTSAVDLAAQLARRQKRLEQDAYRTAKWGAAMLYRRELLERQSQSTPSSRTRVRRPGTRRADGYREPRAQLVTAADLYYTTHLPPAESTDRCEAGVGATPCTPPHGPSKRS
ncbi:hypothetical protein DFH06DRAFT_1338424 [Mycena polygramma]|nr:hypothetical protein DFH06DRAFT_1338424 [Mycena polygramma]